VAQHPACGTWSTSTITFASSTCCSTVRSPRSTARSSRTSGGRGWGSSSKRRMRSASPCEGRARWYRLPASDTPEPSMTISADSVVTIHYTLKDDDGAVIDSSASGEPLAYLHGHGNIVPGLEKELTGRNAGDKVSVRVSPAEGYGEYDKSLVQSVPLRALRGIKDVRPGMHLHAHTEQGPRTVTVTRVVADMVTLDGNHPLAGK